MYIHHNGGRVKEKVFRLPRKKTKEVKVGGGSFADAGHVTCQSSGDRRSRESTYHHQKDNHNLPFPFLYSFSCHPPSDGGKDPSRYIDTDRDVVLGGYKVDEEAEGEKKKKTKD